MECGDYGVAVTGSRVKTVVIVGRDVTVSMIGIG